MSEQGSEIWTIQRILTWTTEFFNSKKIPSGRLDAEILLADVLKCKRLDLYLKFDQPLKDQELKIFKELVVRRSKLEPVAYIIGRQEFYGRPFSVGTGVLIPRPETEHLVDEVLKWYKELEPKPEVLNILDVGCGSGCIGGTLALEIPGAQVTGVDVHEKAQTFTCANAEAHGLAGRFLMVKEDFKDFELTESFNIVVSNPPYISLGEKEKLQKDVVYFEPPEALFGGAKGHEILESWLPKLVRALLPGGLLVCELGYDQGEIGKELATREKKLGDIQIIRDYSGHVRLLKAQKEK